MANSSSKISPILADLSQDIAGAIPLDLIVLWNTSRKSKKKQQELLSQYAKTGTVVSSDSAGLSKLSAVRSLMEVMQLVSEPKEVIYGYGKAVGGEAVGMWVADNTQMFYPDRISVQEIVEAMIAAQKEIKELTVQVGIGIHTGKFLEIGGGLYGEDATFIEELTENDVEGGDIVVTHTVKPKLSSSLIKKLSAHPSYSNAFILDHQDHEVGSLTKHSESQYPYPFNDEFYTLLQSNTLEHSKFAHDKIVVLLKIDHPAEKLFLEELTGYIVANAHIMNVLKKYPEMTLVKSNGNLAILVADSADVAIAFTREVVKTLNENEFSMNAALTKGEVLLFKLKQGYEIAGGPVNVASKLAEDSGEHGKIFVEDSVPIKESGKDQFKFTISKVEIRGKYL